MAQLIVDKNLEYKNESDSESEENQEILENYKGIFYNDEEPREEFHECGAHFSYQDICQKLEIIKNNQSNNESRNNSKNQKSSNGNFNFIKSEKESNFVLQRI